MDVKTRPRASEIETQKLPYPARQSDMRRQPQSGLESYRGAGKLEDRRAPITAGDSGIGRASAMAFAKEGADVAIFFHENADDAKETRRIVEANAGRRCLVIRGDVGESAQCQAAVAQVVATFGGLDLRVNNAAFQMAQPRFEDITEEQFRRTFETNIFGYFHMAKAALPHLREVGRSSTPARSSASSATRS